MEKRNRVNKLAEIAKTSCLQNVRGLAITPSDNHFSISFSSPESSLKVDLENNVIEPSNPGVYHVGLTLADYFQRYGNERFEVRRAYL